ncbi:hypothetical protein FKG94_07365 [Exilibacterium tricleocarpae]|uniref:BamA/TamA family outer membrane protein n=1 Tax=Exilibacterium tricleocarpae TaxID=2591008 RepID=A0A545TZA7_9GAMM|nr:hypothetical protein [Exilibacterium tricleocarpae]TQV82544.1 hypothetical protein FKG94_07365 [Exilibacterium tricleocarpae]
MSTAARSRARCRQRPRRWLVALAGAFSLAADACRELTPESPQEQFEFRLQEYSLDPVIAPGATIGRIDIKRFNVFDLDNPDDNQWYARLANRWHWVTWEKVIRDMLLVKPGDDWSAQKARESERLLRSQHYIYDARVRARKYCDNLVEVEVIVRDVWTLTGGISFTTGGGESRGSIFVSDINAFGTGTSLSLGRTDDSERTGEFIEYRDRQLGGSRWELRTRLADNEDGFDRNLSIGLPFFSLDARRHYLAAWREEERDDTLYFRNDDVEEFGHLIDAGALTLGWSRGLVNGHTTRWQAGWQYQRDRFFVTDETREPNALPEDRTRSFPWLGIERIEDRFLVSQNIRASGRNEDLYVGQRWNLQLGALGSATGSDESLWFLGGNYQNTLHPWGDSLLHTRLGGRGFWDSSNDDWENLHITNTWQWRINPFARRQWLADLRLDYTRNLTRDRQLLLGGDNGLRGYPSRFQAGDRSFLLSIERRRFYDTHLLRLFYAGSAVFVDTGRAWFKGRDNGESGGTLTNVGFGLRVVPSRFRSDRILSIDLAFPLQSGPDIDSYELSIRGRQTF